MIGSSVHPNSMGTSICCSVRHGPILVYKPESKCQSANSLLENNNLKGKKEPRMRHRKPSKFCKQAGSLQNRELSK